MDKLDKKIRYLKRISFINGLFAVLVALLSEFMTNVVGRPYIAEMMQCPIWYESLAGTFLVILYLLPDHTIRKNRAIGLIYALVSLLAAVFSILVCLIIGAPSENTVFVIIYLVLYIVPFVMICGFIAAILTDKTEVLPEQAYKAKRRLFAKGTAAVLVVLGLGITVHAVIRFEQPEDFTKWQQYELGNTGVSVLMPDNRKEADADELIRTNQIVIGSGSKMIVVMSESENEEDEEESEDYKYKIVSEDTYTEDGIEYTRRVEKNINEKDKMMMYVSSITFEYNGKIYSAGVMSGRITPSLKRDINKILDTLAVDKSAKQL